MPGCGETPYVKLLSQLFGDRIVIGNATGCSSIYGGNLPTTPYCHERGRARAGLVQFAVRGQRRVRLGHPDGHRRQAAVRRALLKQVAGQVGDDLAQGVAVGHAGIRRGRSSSSATASGDLLKRLAGIDTPEAKALATVADDLARKSVWILGGDGWAYDIGFGGLDHVLASGRDVNVLVHGHRRVLEHRRPGLESHPAGAVAKFAAAGKPIHKKDLGMIAASYGNVYVGQIAISANPAQTVKVFHEAESYPGPSLILAYSNCIAHGIDMTTGDDPSERCGAVRLLAAVPLRPAAGRRRRQAVPVGQQEADRVVQGVRQHGSPLHDAGQVESSARGAAVRVGPEGHRRPVALLRTNGRRRTPTRRQERGRKPVSVDLSTTYLGLKLKNPLVASASPLTGNMDTLRQLEEAGAAAAVCPSLFEEQIVHEEMELGRLYDYGADSFAESAELLPRTARVPHRLRQLHGAHRRGQEEPRDPDHRQPERFVRGRLGASTRKQIQDAGADALELNIYFVSTDDDMPSDAVEQRYLDLVAAVKAKLTIPLAVKIGAAFSGLPNFARRLVEAGADGLVLFNRWLEPDIDLESLGVPAAIGAQFAARTAVAAALDRHPPRPALRLVGRHQRRALHRGRGQSPARRRGRHDAGLRAAAARAGLHQPTAERTDSTGWKNASTLRSSN